MIKNILKSKEPVVYTSLYNDLKNDKVSHSYLFVGEYNPLKLEAAYLLAQSIIEGKNDFACEECSANKRTTRSTTREKTTRGSANKRTTRSTSRNSKSKRASGKRRC